MQTLQSRVTDHVVFLVVLLVGWSVAVSASSFFPSPMEIVIAFVTQVENGSLPAAIRSALRSIFLGYFLAILVGIPTGLAMGINRHAESLLDPYVNALYVVPFGAMVPALIIWFGTGYQVRVVVVFFFAIFPIVINTLEGAKTVPADLVEVAQSFGAKRWFIVKNVVVPHEITYIVAALRLAIGRAVKGLVVTEILISVSGFGLIITQWSARYALGGVFSVVIVLMALGVLFTGVLGQIEKRAIRWDTADI